jgi:hypothetical protein
LSASSLSSGVPHYPPCSISEEMVTLKGSWGEGTSGGAFGDSRGCHYRRNLALTSPGSTLHWMFVFGSGHCDTLPEPLSLSPTAPESCCL